MLTKRESERMNVGIHIDRIRQIQKDREKERKKERGNCIECMRVQALKRMHAAVHSKKVFLSFKIRRAGMEQGEIKRNECQS